MLIRIIFCLVLLILGHVMFAQERPEENAIIQPSESRMSHYVGIQANQLIKQLINFGGSSSIITNPYLLTYSANSKKTGLGFSTGLGASTIQTKNTDNFVSTVSKTNDFAWRAGIEKKSYLSRRWLTSFGFDLLAEYNKSTVKANAGGAPVSTVSTKESRVGCGPRVALNYQFHDRLLIGTEASLYFKWIKNTTKNGDGPNNPSDETDLKSVSITAPAVLFVMMKF